MRQNNGDFEVSNVTFRDEVKYKVNHLTVHSLTELNDTLEFTFDEIADFIEDNWQHLLKN